MVWFSASTCLFHATFLFGNTHQGIGERVKKQHTLTVPLYMLFTVIHLDHSHTHTHPHTLTTLTWLQLCLRICAGRLTGIWTVCPKRNYCHYLINWDCVIHKGNNDQWTAVHFSLIWSVMSCTQAAHPEFWLTRPLVQNPPMLSCLVYTEITEYE